MSKELDWGDDSVGKGFGANKESKLKVKDGEQLILRIVTKLYPYKSHSVDDMLPKRKDGTPGVFNMNCAQIFNDDTGEYEGECRGEDRGYETNTRYTCGVLALAFKRGKTITPFDPTDSPKWWDLTDGRIRDMKQFCENKGIDASKMLDYLKKTNLLFSLKAGDKSAEEYQKIVIDKWEGDKFDITAAHTEAYKAKIPAIIAEVSAPSTVKDQDRRLKRKKPEGGAAAEPATESQDDSVDDLDLDLDGDSKPATPAPAAKKSGGTAVATKPAAKKAAPAPAPEPEVAEEAPVEDEEAAVDLDAPEPAKSPAPAAKKVAGKPAPKKPASNDEVDDILAGL